MRSKRRQTNIQLLQRGLEELTTNSTLPIAPPAPPQTSKASDSICQEVKLIDKPKKARGAPKRALINTARLLTG